jgi:hypothetical protein
MANCSQTSLVEFPGFLGVFDSIRIKKVVFFAFLGGVFAGGGWEQWSVASGQWPVATGGIFWVSNFHFSTFLDSDVPYWMAGGGGFY